MEGHKQGSKKGLNILKWALIGLGSLLVLILAFGAGIFVGQMKARFSYRWAENYHRMFAGPREGFLGGWRKFPPPEEFIEAHGTFGQIIKINGSELVVKGRGDVEKVIVVTNETVIEKGRFAIKKEDLMVGDYVVVIGSPNEQGQIEAKLIRVFPRRP